MKPKVIAIVIAVVITAGTATGVGVAVSRNNDKQTEELVSAAVSEALATVESTTAESTTAESTTENTTEAATAESTTAKVVQKSPKQEVTKEEESITAPQIVDNNNNSPNLPPPPEPEKYTIDINTPLGTITINKRNTNRDSYGNYWNTPLTYTLKSEPERQFDLYIDENNNLFYHQYDTDNKLVRVYPEF